MTSMSNDTLPLSIKMVWSSEVHVWDPQGACLTWRKKMGVIGRVAIYLVFNKQEVETNSCKSIVFISVLFYSYFLAPACLLYIHCLQGFSETTKQELWTTRFYEANIQCISNKLQIFMAKVWQGIQVTRSCKWPTT